MTFWQKTKRVVTSPLGRGLELGTVVGVGLAAASVFAFGVSAFIGATLFLTSVSVGALWGAVSYVRDEFYRDLGIQGINYYMWTRHGLHEDPNYQPNVVSNTHSSFWGALGLDQDRDADNDRIMREYNSEMSRHPNSRKGR